MSFIAGPGKPHVSARHRVEALPVDQEITWSCICISIESVAFLKTRPGCKGWPWLKWVPGNIKRSKSDLHNTGYICNYWYWDVTLGWKVGGIQSMSFIVGSGKQQAYQNFLGSFLQPNYDRSSKCGYFGTSHADNCERIGIIAISRRGGGTKNIYRKLIIWHLCIDSTESLLVEQIQIGILQSLHPKTQRSGGNKTAQWLK